MPKFAANLTMMFNEVSFPQRFSAAARAGFDAVEFMFPYDPPQEVAGWLRENGLQNVLFNMPPGDWTAGDREWHRFRDARRNSARASRGPSSTQTLLARLGSTPWPGCL